jgi:hypothetical protein
VEPVLDRGAAQLIGLALARAPLMPPPASHMVKP